MSGDLNKQWGGEGIERRVLERRSTDSMLEQINILGVWEGNKRVGQLELYLEVEAFDVSLLRNESKGRPELCPVAEEFTSL